MGADLRGRQVVLKRFPWSGAQSCSPLTIPLTKAPESGQFLADSCPRFNCRATLSLTPQRTLMIIRPTLCPALGAF